MGKQDNENRSYSRRAAILTFLVLLTAMTATAWLLHWHDAETAYTSAIDQFISAMQSGDAKKVLALESTAFQNKVKLASIAYGKNNKTNFVTNNYYVYCGALGQYSAYDFSVDNVRAATIQTKVHKAGQLITDVKEVFTTKTTTPVVDDDTGEPGLSETSFTIDAVPGPTGWLVNDVANSNFTF